MTMHVVGNMCEYVCLRCGHEFREGTDGRVQCPECAFILVEDEPETEVYGYE